MADENFIITIVGTIATTIISVVILRSLKYFEKKQDTKAEEVKKTAKEAAEMAKIQAQKIAEELTRKNEERSIKHKENAASIAEELRQENLKRDEDIAKNLANNADRIREEQMIQSQKISEDLKTTTSNIAAYLEKKTDNTSKEILNNIQDVDRRLTAMIDSLQRGAELTNGNVTKIRSDILELQDDVDNIYDKINKEEIQNNPQKKLERDRKRKIRRRQITNDSILHHHQQQQQQQERFQNDNNNNNIP
jgi:hypothetical protein